MSVDPEPAADTVPVEPAPLVASAPLEVPAEPAPGPALPLSAELIAQAERLDDERSFRRGLEVMVPGLALLFLGLLTFGIFQRLGRPEDLAEGKPWVASSSWGACDPRIGRCGPLVSRIIFHTLEDESPWYRIDLGQPTRFSGMTIANRTDDAPERAVPLLIEVGDDTVTWKEVARRESMFTIWRPTFDPVTARYVRVRAPRKTWLHLEAAKVHP